MTLLGNFHLKSFLFRVYLITNNLFKINLMMLPTKKVLAKDSNALEIAMITG